MPLSRPTLPQQIDQSRSDLQVRLGIEETLRRTDVEAYARVIAAESHSLSGMIEYIAKQIIWDSADIDYLRRWASIFGIYEKQPFAATGNVTFTTVVGSIIEAGTILKATDGQEYSVLSGGVASGITYTTAVVALVAGAAGNKTAGQYLTLISPISGVNSRALAGEISQGADLETPDQLRARFLARVQSPPHGGSVADYEAWALEVAGVTRAWVFAGEMGAGTVTVRFVRDGDTPIIPDPAEVAAVYNYIDVRRPVTAGLYVAAPVALPIALNIHLNPDTTEIRTAVTAELVDFFKREGAPGSIVYLSRLNEIISSARGEYDHTLVTPSANVTVANNQIAQLGAITWS